MTYLFKRIKKYVNFDKIEFEKNNFRNRNRNERLILVLFHNLFSVFANKPLRMIGHCVAYEK